MPMKMKPFNRIMKRKKKRPEEFYYIEEFIDEPYGKEMAMINYLNIMEKQLDLKTVFFTKYKV